jgi:hypothetical protein
MAAAVGDREWRAFCPRDEDPASRTPVAEKTAAKALFLQR